MPSLQDLRDHFGAFYLAINPGYNWVRYQQLQIIPHLEAVERGDIQRLAIFMPPGHAKSDLGTRGFIPWYLGRNPSHNAMVCSYSADLASDDFGANIKARMETPLYRQIFPRSVPTRDSRSKAHFTNQSGGSFYSVGFQGGITGKRLNCFPAGTLVTTELGLIDIAVLHRMKYPPKILGYNHMLKTPEWRSIKATRKARSNAIVEISTNSGRRIRCTRDHRIYTANGYRQAALLRPGDDLLTTDLYDLRAARLAKEHKLSGVLSETTSGKHAYRADLRSLWREVQQVASRVREAINSWASFFLLYPRAFSRALLGEISPPMLSVPSPRSNGSEILFSRMSANYSERSQTQDKLWPVRRKFYPTNEPVNLLQSAMQESRSFYSHERFGKFTFQNWDKLREIVSEDETVNFRARWESVCNMQWNLSPRRPSYRREPDKQYSDKFDYFVPQLPYCSPQIESDTVAMVRDLRAGGIAVYDLQVEGTNNFFADGILVHNCMLLDDLIKNKGDAESDTVQADLFETYKSTVKDRLRPNGKIIMVMHRWLTNDVAGRILEMDGTVDEGGAWTVLKLPAEDPPDSGHYLWEEYYGKEYYEDFKKDDETWASKFQQDPGSSLSYKFREDWLQFYDVPPPTTRFKSYIIVDPAASKSRSSDFTVVGVLCPAQDKKLILADWIWDRLDPGERTEAILRLCRRWNPEALYYESYGLNADSYYLKEKMLLDNFPQSAYPRVVGRTGSGHNNSKEVRIDSLIPFFREGKIVLPRKFERTRYDGTRVDYTDNFIKYEYAPYRGKKSVPHDDNLDMLSRIADPDVHIDYDIPQDANMRPSGYTRPLGSSWYSLY